MEEVNQEKPAKRFLSATQISMFLRCPKQWEFRYVEGRKNPPSGAMVQSKAWHRTVEQNYTQKIESEKDLPLSHMQEFFASAYDEALQAEEIDFGTNEDPGRLKDQGVDITTAHHKFVAPKVRPLLVEEKFCISLGDDFPFDLLGYWDLVDKDGMVVDNKAYKPQ